MESIKQISRRIGFLIVVGTPSYFVYDLRRIAQGRAGFLNYLLLAASAITLLCLVSWVARRRGRNYAWLKPLWERPIALIMLIVSAPLLFIVAMFIKVESHGPVFYRQERVGKNYRRRSRRQNPGSSNSCVGMNRRQGDRRRTDLGGRPFVIYKLRSMKVDAEESTGAAWSTGDYDPRVTTIGYYIRKTHVDELPQLINVLRGQMSIIGPRPERPAFVEELSSVIDGYRDRLHMQPGITGLAQVRQGHDESLDDVLKKLEHDREYLRNASLLLDAKIVFETIALIFNLFWSALRKRTVEKKTEPKTVAVLVSDSVGSERG